MPMYLVRFSYTPEAWAALIEKPEDRRQAAKAVIEAAGGKLHGLWYAFGEQDGYVLIEGPDNMSAAAASVAIAATGRFRSLETTVLLSVEEVLEALKKAKQFAYRPPGAK